MLNALTIDVEDYFHVNAFKKVVRRSDWDLYPLRVVQNTRRILDLLDRHGCKATFFVLGWVARKAPDLVREMACRGHEVASHGMYHELVYDMEPECFRGDVRYSKKLLEDICGQEVRGYRAPSYSITRRSLWALDILVEEGFQYDSSIFPIRHDTYGIPEAGRFPHRLERSTGSIMEFPLTTVRMGPGSRKANLPVAGGGYLRLAPLWFVKRALAGVNRRESKPVVVYFHPWEIDPDQPRIRVGMRSRFRHYVNLETMEHKLGQLLSFLDFAPMATVLGRMDTVWKPWVVESEAPCVRTEAV
jgi:polysaccharide deacetylase family protein (PEP-CTERM system associated)